MLDSNPFVGVSLVLLVIADYINAGRPCTFQIAGSVSVVYCETDCCANTCCRQSQDGSSTAGIVLGVVAAAVLVVIVVILIVCCCKHRFPWFSRKKNAHHTQIVSPVTESKARTTPHSEVISLHDMESTPHGAEPAVGSVRETNRERTFNILP